jgi:hypothetical protein
MTVRYKVTINKRGYIPAVGNGPIKRPITISESIYNNLVKLGYPVEVVSKTGDINKSVKTIINKTETPVAKEPVKEIEKVSTPEVTSEVVDNTPEPVIPDVKKTEEVIDNDDVVDGLSDEVDEEVNDEEEVAEVADDEVVVNDKDLSAESYYEDSFLSSKNMCKKILDKRGVSYDTGASFTVLKKLVAESNPEVTIEE